MKHTTDISAPLRRGPTDRVIDLEAIARAEREHRESRKQAHAANKRALRRDQIEKAMRRWSRAKPIKQALIDGGLA